MDTQNNVPAKPVNPHRISSRQFFVDNGLETEEARYDFLEGIVAGCDNAPALCKEGCEVEPDGRCEHGCPSILIVLGMI